MEKYLNSELSGPNTGLTEVSMQANARIVGILLASTLPHCSYSHLRRTFCFIRCFMDLLQLK